MTTHQREEGEAGEEEGREEEEGVRPPSVQQLQQGWRLLRRPEALPPAINTLGTAPMTTITS